MAEPETQDTAAVLMTGPTSGVLAVDIPGYPAGTPVVRGDNGLWRPASPTEPATTFAAGAQWATETPNVLECLRAMRDRIIRQTGLPAHVMGEKMSLDVYLYAPQPDRTELLVAADVLAERGFAQAEAVLRAKVEEQPECLFDRNITHNLNRMAEAAGVYEACWRPDEIGITKAKELIPLLGAGLTRLTYDPQRFREFNPSNGWGNYDGLLAFLNDYLAACQRHPEADVRVSR